MIFSVSDSLIKLDRENTDDLEQGTDNLALSCAVHSTLQDTVHCTTKYKSNCKQTFVVIIVNLN